MISNKLDDMFLYFMILIVLELIVLILKLISVKPFKSKYFKNSYVFVYGFIISILGLLVFKINWDFVGENKDSVITGNGFLFTVIVINLISLILLLIFGIIKIIKDKIITKSSR